MSEKDELILYTLAILLSAVAFLVKFQFSKASEEMANHLLDQVSHIKIFILKSKKENKNA